MYNTLEYCENIYMNSSTGMYHSTSRKVPTAVLTTIVTGKVGIPTVLMIS